MRKLSLDYIKKSFEEEGYILLTTEYINNAQKLDFICTKGHKHSITWYHWQQGTRCIHCAGLSKPTIEFVRAEFEKENYTLLSKEYINSDTKLDYSCPEGYRHSITWHSWNGGHRCPHCSGMAKHTIEFVKEQFELEGYELLSKEYINNGTKMSYRCTKGHEHSITWRDWVSGYRCTYCAGKDKKTIEFIKEQFAKEDYGLISKEYVGAHSKLNYKCKDNHEHSITWNDWQQGVRCPTCMYISRLEGGSANKDYCPVWSDKEFKEMIKERDNHECQNPYCWHTIEKLCIHHIDYNKKNCSPDNLITVCTSCNGRANANREWHTAFYKTIIGNMEMYE